MILALTAKVIFFGLSAIIGLYSALMVYILLRFGHSKILGLVVSVFYIMVITTLYAAALANFNAIEFPDIIL